MTTRGNYTNARRMSKPKRASTGALAKANEEVLTEVRQAATHLGTRTARYVLKPLVLLAMRAAGLPEEAQAVVNDVIEDCAGAVFDGDVETVKLRAAACNGVINLPAYRNKHASITRDQLRSLVQRLTATAVRDRIESRVRMFAAIGVGGLDEDLATIDDLKTLDWAEAQPDWMLAFTTKLAHWWIGDESTHTVLPPPSKRNDFKIDVPFPHRTYPLRNVMTTTEKERWELHLDPDSKFGTQKGGHAVGWHGKVILLSSQLVQVHETVEDGTVLLAQYWPSPMLQRIHAAVVGQREAMQYELDNLQGQPTS